MQGPHGFTHRHGSPSRSLAPRCLLGLEHGAGHCFLTPLPGASEDFHNCQKQAFVISPVNYLSYHN